MLYHVSPTHGITRLEPRVSTHGFACVYAIDDLTTALLFGAKKDDFDFDLSTDENGHPTLSECYPDALSICYAGKSCSVYELAEDGFERGRTSWSPELVCSHAVDVLRETFVGDLYARLLEEEAAGRLTIRRFEDTPEYKAFVAAHVVDRLIRFGVDLKGCLREGSRFERYYRPLVEGLIALTDGHLL